MDDTVTGSNVGAARKVEVPERHWDAMFAPSSCLTMITTSDDDGRVNAATFGTCTRVAHDPVYLLFATTARPLSDTLANVRSTGQFVVNPVPFVASLLEKARIAGLPFETGVNELERAGLTSLPSLQVRPPRIAELYSHFECELAWIQEFEHRAVVCGRVVAVSMNEECYDTRGVVRWDVLKPAHYAGAPYGGNFVPAYPPLWVGRPYDGPADWRPGTPDVRDLPDIIAHRDMHVEYGGEGGVGGPNERRRG